MSISDFILRKTLTHSGLTQLLKIAAKAMTTEASPQRIEIKSKTKDVGFLARANPCANGGVGESIGKRLAWVFLVLT